MTAFVALLRAVNVGGTGTLPKKELGARTDDHAQHQSKLVAMMEE